MVEINKEKIVFIAALITLLLSGCANQLPPGGGGVDLVPPRVMGTYPKNRTTEFKEDYIKIDFSKYIVHRTFSDALFISPAVGGETEYDWTGTSVTVYFGEKLKKNVTYVVTIGSNVQDYNNHNHMTQSYSFAFSTGDKIDKGSISGKVFTEKPGGLMMFAYLKDDSTINPMKLKPAYISQTGKGGEFKLLGLKDGRYRIFAVRDQYMDLIYQPDQDEIGVPYKEVKLTATDSVFQGLNFFITKFDTVKPRLISAVMTDRNHVLLKFSKEIDTSTVKSYNFRLIDSTLQKSIVPRFAFRGKTKPDEAVLVVDSAFPAEDEAFAGAKVITDNYGNVYKSDITSLTLSQKKDTTKPGILSTVPPKGSSNADFIGQDFRFYFNDAFDSLSAKKNITFTDTTGTAVPYTVRFLDDASFGIKPDNNLKPNTDYQIKLELSGFADIAGNSYDSVYIYEFKTINGLDFTGISGKLTGPATQGNPNLVLENFKKEGEKYEIKAGTDGKFNFKRILPGKYRLWCFDDVNNNGQYDFGKAFPYKPSERFWVYPDTLNLRARWTQTNLIFKTGK